MAKVAQMLAKIDSLIETSHYDDEKLLAPYALWPSHKHVELKEWLDERARQSKDKLTPAPNPYG